MFLSAALAVMACACGSGSAGPIAFGDMPAGNAADLKVGDVRVVPNASACIVRDAGGVYAMTLTCTHQGCDMSFQGSVTSSGISCACHGSEFDLGGRVVRGPANAPLDHFAVSADAQGNLTVHGGTVVGASTRLMV